MITALKFKEIIAPSVPCKTIDRVVLLYGYTFERESTYVFFLDKKLVRVEEDRKGKVKRWIESYFVRPEFFAIKRWYRNATVPELRKFVESFHEYGLTETDGGHRKYLTEYHASRPEDVAGALYKDDRLIDLDDAPVC